MWRWVLVGLALVLSCALDETVTNALRRPIPSGQIKAVLSAMRCWGDGSTIVVISAAIWLGQPNRRREVVAALFATLISGAFVDSVKPMFGRPRPAEAHARLAGRGAFEDRFNSSFPSGHSATAFAFAHCVSNMFPAIKPVCIAAACGTGLSRMHDQRHYLSDCVAGAFIGWPLAGIAWPAFARLRFASPTWLWPNRVRNQSAA